MSALAGQTALVTGATGFLGGALIHRLTAEGVGVKALARRPHRDAYIKDLAKVEIVMGDITDLDRMTELAKGCDYVFHVAAATGGKLPLQRRVNVTGTHNVTAAAAAAQVKRLVHVSTIAVYGYQSRAVITENTPQQPGKVPYNISKSEAEAALRDVAEVSNLSYSIIRPGMIYGPRSGAWTAQVFKWAQRKPMFFIGDGSGTTFTIFVDDVVDMMLQLAIHPAADREAFNCVNAPPPTWREYLGAYMQLVDNASWFALPEWLAFFVAPLAEFYFTLSGEPQDIRHLISFTLGNTRYSMAKARQLLEWQPQTNLENGIQRCIPYLQQKGLL